MPRRAAPESAPEHQLASPLAVNDLGLPTPPHAPGKPPHTRGFGTLPRASVYVYVAETASLRRLFFVACGRLPCPR
eukprot:scaffold50013_cov53-Phaeocystis_antarctica.AAC.2